MGGGTTSYKEMEETDVILLWGSNARETHPIFFHHVLAGIHNGARLYAVDPRRTTSAQWAVRHLPLHVGSDIALANAVAREILAAGLENRSFVEHATSGFEAFRDNVEPWTLERAEAVTGVPAESIREMAHAYARADRAVICWTLGITEHHNAVDNVRALINLALLTGHVGRYGSGVNPLRGQNNVQGGGDMGALPDRLPGFQHVENDELRGKFERAWGAKIPPQRGWHLSGMFDAMERGDLTALYVIGENPASSESDQHRTLASPRRARHPGRPGHAPHRDRQAGPRRVPRRRRLVRIRGHGDQQRAPGPAGAPRPAAAGRGARRHGDPLRAGPPPGPGSGRPQPPQRRGAVERGAQFEPGPCRHVLRSAGGARRSPVAVLRRVPSRGDVPPRPTLGTTGRRPAGPLRRCPGRSAGRGAVGGVPPPLDHRATAGLLQHRRPDRPLLVAEPPPRDPRSFPGGRPATRYGRRGGRARRLPARERCSPRCASTPGCGRGSPSSPSTSPTRWRPTS